MYTYVRLVINDSQQLNDYLMFIMQLLSTINNRLAPFCTNAVSKATYLVRINWKHGLRMPNEAFFHRNPKLLGLGRQFV